MGINCQEFENNYWISFMNKTFCSLFPIGLVLSEAIFKKILISLFN